MSNLSIENLGKTFAVDPIANTNSRVTRELNGPGSVSPMDGVDSVAGSSGSFAQVLRDSFDQVNTHQVQADRAMQELVTGRTKNIHETMLSVERADMSLKILMQVRNKILDAYREVMRMQV